MEAYERRLFRTELRAEGRRLTGTAMVYGDTSPSHRERFEPGALQLAEAVTLNLLHEPLQAIAWAPGGGLDFEHDQSELRMVVADAPPTPAGNLALELVREGQAKGLSIEFRAERDRREDGVRIVESAVLSGLAIVRAPSYKQSQIEARRASGKRLPVWL